MDPMSVSEMQKYLGKGGRYKANGFSFDVRVIDVRSDRSCGMEFLVIPGAGEGKGWVASSLVLLENPPGGPIGQAEKEQPREINPQTVPSKEPG
jgi:hypothetical protein